MTPFIEILSTEKTIENIKKLADRRYRGKLVNYQSKEKAINNAVSCLENLKSNEDRSEIIKFIDSHIEYYKKMDRQNGVGASCGPWRSLTNCGHACVVDRLGLPVARMEVKNKFLKGNLALILSAQDLFVIAEAVMNGKGNDQHVCELAMETVKKINS